MGEGPSDSGAQAVTHPPTLTSQSSQATLAADVDESAPRAPSLLPGASVGRYLVLRERGRGGMGVVYAAYDPELDRRIALKVLRSRAAPRSSAGEARETLLHEAQAMAKLRHPNVITVHDVGQTAEGAVFLAMEYVDGQDARAWVETPRTWRVVRDLYVAAGHGLHAAHVAGIVHRDFKPDNILRDDSGRVLVTDLGLASPLLPRDGTTSSRSDASGAEPTPNAIAGTPAYMALERYRGDPGDERTDVFAFCVALYEGLYGHRPYDGETPAQLVHAMTSGAIDPGGDRDVPAWLRRVVVRGLAADPAARWPSMEPLLIALERDPGTLRIGLALGATIAAALVTTGVLIGREPSDPWCERRGEPLAGVWDDERRGALAEVFAAMPENAAADVHGRALRRLDERAQEWTAMREEVCTSADETDDRRRVLVRSCMDARREDLTILVETLLGASSGHRLESLDRIDEQLRAVDCRDPRWLGAVNRLPSAPAERSAWLAANAQVSRIQSLRILGQLDAATDEIERVRAALANLGDASLASDAELQAARVSAARGDVAQARTEFLGAVELALEAADPNRIGERLLAMAHFEATRWGDPKSGRMFAELARAAIAGGGDHSETLALLHNTRAVLDIADKAWLDARRELLRARELAESESRLDPILVDSIENNLAIVSAELGDRARAAEEFRRLAATRRERYGPRHPRIVSPLTNLAMVLARMGKLDEARVAAEESLAILVGSYGADNVRLIATLNVLQSICWDRGDTAQMHEHALRSFTIAEAHLRLHDVRRWGATDTYGDTLVEGGRALAGVEAIDSLLALIDPGEHPDKGATLLETRAKANIELLRGADALADARHARRLRAQGEPIEGPGTVADVRMGAALVLMGRPRDALASFVRTADAGKRLTGDAELEHHYWLARAHADLGETDQAVAAYEAAVALDKLGWFHGGAARLGLAALLDAPDRDPRRARALVVEVLGFGKDYERYHRLHAQARQWLAARPAE